MAHHRHQLEVESGIDPRIIELGGTYSTTDVAHLRSLGFAESQCRPEMGPFLVFPEWSTAGVQVGYKIKPDHPRMDGDKAIKYETPAGMPLHFDCSPDGRDDLRDTSIPLYMTEGRKKRDAAASRGLCTVSLSGVYAFLREKLVIDDLDDIKLPGRKVYVVFDDDVMTNPKVADALRRLCAALLRRGAKIFIIILPENPNGAKVGLDDYFVNGGTVKELEVLAQRWNPHAGLATSAPASDIHREVIELRKKVKQQERHISALTHLFREKRIAATDKAVAVSAIAHAHAKRSRGEVEPDGRVRLEDRHIANDHRPITPKGVPRPETNNDGTYPITDRKRVKTILSKLAEINAVTIDTDKVVKTHHATGDRYRVEDVLITISDDISADLLQLTEHAAPKKKRDRYTKQEPCQSCGEVHDRTRRTYCNSCGSEYEPAKHIPVPALQIVDDDYTEHAAESASEKNSEASKGAAAPRSAPITYLSEKNSEAHRPPSTYVPPPNLHDQFRAMGVD